ncbi:bifunctional metallophosphatase/5'-nucleotidase [Paenibacillus sp. CAU 1782]
MPINPSNTITAVCDIMMTSDIHGAIRPVDYNTNAPRREGLAMLASLVASEREKSPELLLIDNGDLLQGSPLASYAAAFTGQEDIHPFINVLNELRYDAAVIGNHEFNYGLPLLRKAVQDSRFPWLSANIVALEGQTPVSENPPTAGLVPAFGPPYMIKTLSSGVKVALLGVTTHYIPNWEQPAHIHGLAFLDTLETVRRWVSHIHEHEQPDVLAVSYHGGFERDPESGEPTERLTGENQGYAICMEVEGIDVLLTGHQHRRLTGEINGVTIVQPGVSGAACGRIAIELEKREGERWRIMKKEARLLEADSEGNSPDRAVMELTETTEAAAQAWLDQPIGVLDGNLSVDDPFLLRLREHPFMSFVHQVQMEATGAELSSAAFLSEQGGGFSGSITVRDISSNFIYPNTLTVLRLSGRDIKEALEQSARYFAMNDTGEIGVNPDYLRPKPQHYNYDMWAGIHYELNIAKPPGSRVAKLERSGQPLEMDGEYSVVMNNYRASGGGDYAMYVGKPVLYEGADDMAALVERYIRNHQPLSVPKTGNWRVTAPRD